MDTGEFRRCAQNTDLDQQLLASKIVTSLQSPLNHLQRIRLAFQQDSFANLKAWFHSLFSAQLQTYSGYIRLKPADP